jgi:hypothetical protein
MRRTPCVVMLVMAFLATHLVCICAAPVLAATTVAADPHACCHPSGSSAPRHHESRACQHCAHAQVVVPESSTRPASFASAMVALLPPAIAIASRVDPLVAAARGAGPNRDAPPGPIRHCVRQL